MQDGLASGFAFKMNWFALETIQTWTQSRTFGGSSKPGNVIQSSEQEQRSPDSCRGCGMMMSLKTFVKFDSIYANKESGKVEEKLNFEC